MKKYRFFMFVCFAALSISSLLCAFSSSFYLYRTSGSIGLMDADVAVGEGVTALYYNSFFYDSPPIVAYEYSLFSSDQVIYQDPVNGAVSFSIGSSSISLSKGVSTLPSDFENRIRLDAYQTGFYSLLKEFYWTVKIQYMASIQPELNSHGNGLGYLAGFIKEQGSFRFGVFYKSRVNLDWKNNEDIILFNHLPAQLDAGTRMQMGKNHFLYFNMKYIFPQLRRSGNATRNYLLYKDEVDLSVGSRLKGATGRIGWDWDLGFQFLPDNALGSINNGPLKLIAGTGCNVIFDGFPLIIKIAYGQEIERRDFQQFKLGLEYDL